MSTEDLREQQLRRLLTEAVEPIEPGPGAQTRLLARARSQAERRRRHRADVLRWAVPVTIVSLALIFAATFGVIVARDGGGSSKGASTAASGPATVSAPAASAEAGPSRAPNAANAVPGIPPTLTPDLRSDAGTGTSASRGSQFSPGSAKAPALPSDLDGDGRADTFAVNGGQLRATLSTGGTQTVELPATGAGARVLGVVLLSDPSGNTVPVLFVRLRQSGSTFTDTVVAVVGGRLTVIQRGSEPLLLTVDATHGYGCNQRNLVLAGDSTPYVIDGAQVVASPQLRAITAPAGETAGCGF